MATINPILFNSICRELQRKYIDLVTGGTVNEPKQKTRKKRFSMLKKKDLVFGN